MSGKFPDVSQRPWWQRSTTRQGCDFQVKGIGVFQSATRVERAWLIQAATIFVLATDPDRESSRNGVAINKKRKMPNIFKRNVNYASLVIIRGRPVERINELASV